MKRNVCGEQAAATNAPSQAAYGAGDFGFNFSWAFTSVFLLYFYTDVLGLSPAVAGSIYMLALVVDAVTDPLLGELVERTRTPYGRFRPYLIFGAVPLALSIVALAAVPGLAPNLLAVAAGLTHVLFRIAFAATNIPYSALMARITRDPHDRTDLAALRMVFGSLASSLVAISAHPALALLGGENRWESWSWFCAAMSVLTAIFVWLSAWATHGLDIMSDAETTERTRPPLAGQLALMGRSLRNRAFLVVAGSMFVTTFMYVFFQKNVIYWFEYGLGDKASSGLALALPGLVSLVCVPLWTWLLKRVAKHHIAILGGIILALSFVLFLVLGRMSTAGALVAIVVFGVGYAASNVCGWSMLPDTVEYGEWKTGVRNEGLTFGVMQVMQKSAIGYKAHAVQSPSTLAGLIGLMTLVPLGGAFIKVALLSFYPLTHERHRVITEKLALRAASVAAA